MTIKVLVVDDSAFMRIALRKMLEAYPDIAVVGEAKNGRVAVQMAAELRPDVVTMDVEMPELDGISATRQIMAATPCSILMVSSLTLAGAATTMKALEAGAVDFIPKQSSFVQIDIVKIGDELAGKIRFWADRRRRAAAAPAVPTAAGRHLRKTVPSGKLGLVVIGVSTGGPAAVPVVLNAMGRLSCPTVIAQHMPPVFTRGFADFLRDTTGLNVVEGENGMPLAPGMVVIAPGGTDSFVREPFPGRLMLYQKSHDGVAIHPSVDLLFRSARSASVELAAVIMTGMGNDGTAGARALAQRNAPILVQDPASCVVDGMPESAIAADLASEILSLDGIGRRLARWGGQAIPETFRSMELR